MKKVFHSLLPSKLSEPGYQPSRILSKRCPNEGTRGASPFSPTHVSPATCMWCSERVPYLVTLSTRTLSSMPKWRKKIAVGATKRERESHTPQSTRVLVQGHILGIPASNFFLTHRPQSTAPLLAQRWAANLSKILLGMTTRPRGMKPQREFEN